MIMYKIIFWETKQNSEAQNHLLICTLVIGMEPRRAHLICSMRKKCVVLNQDADRVVGCAFVWFIYRKCSPWSTFRRRQSKLRSLSIFQ